MNREVVFAKAFADSSWNAINYLRDHRLGLSAPSGSSTSLEFYDFNAPNHEERCVLICDWCGANNVLQALECRCCGSPIIK